MTRSVLPRLLGLLAFAAGAGAGAVPVVATVRLPSGTPFVVEVALTDSARERGLSGRESMDWNHGMLFTFPDTASRGFWMVDCHFPLDLAYIGPGGIVRDIVQMVPEPGVPRERLRVYRSRTDDVVWALEVNQGFLAAQGWSIGDTLRWVTTLPSPRPGR